MATNTKSNFLIPELLAESMATGFTGIEVFHGSAAVVVNPSLPTSARGGQTVTVPYLSNLGEFEDVSENVALTPATVSSSSEQSTVIRSGKAIEITEWAQIAAAHQDPYAYLTGQMKAGA